MKHALGTADTGAGRAPAMKNKDLGVVSIGIGAAVAASAPEFRSEWAYRIVL